MNNENQNPKNVEQYGKSFLSNIINLEKSTLNVLTRFVLGKVLTDNLDLRNSNPVFKITSQNLESISTSLLVLAHEAIMIFAVTKLTHEPYFLTVCAMVASVYFCISAITNNRIYAEDIVIKKVEDTLNPIHSIERCCQLTKHANVLTRIAASTGTMGLLIQIVRLMTS